jgi:GNAT superfamily N-acetyltransferase
LAEPAITIRPALADDADGITRTFLESAEYHAGIDPERYSIPAAAEISARYRKHRQHPHEATTESITFVAELNKDIVGFADVRLECSPDPMHRKLTYCRIVEIAVSSRHQNRGVGAALMRAAENWGREQNAEFACLEYLAPNKRAANFYEHNGYRVAALTAIKRL